VIPDLSDNEKMARVGRLSTLYKARRKAAQELRNLLIPMLNNIEGEHSGNWDVSGIVELVKTIQHLSDSINEQ
jgi:hypothetical protein